MTRHGVALATMFTHRDVLGKDDQLHATVTVTTFGPDFLHGAEGEYMLEDFPESRQSVVVEWDEGLQDFTIKGIR